MWIKFLKRLVHDLFFPIINVAAIICRYVQSKAVIIFLLFTFWQREIIVICFPIYPSSHLGIEKDEICFGINSQRISNSSTKNPCLLLLLTMGVILVAAAGFDVFDLDRFLWGKWPYILDRHPGPSSGWHLGARNSIFGPVLRCCSHKLDTKHVLDSGYRYSQVCFPPALSLVLLLSPVPVLLLLSSSIWLDCPLSCSGNDEAWAETWWRFLQGARRRCGPELSMRGNLA